MAKNESYVSELTNSKLREFLDFPFELDSKGKLKTIHTTSEAVETFLINFFNTPKKHRVMESGLGTDIHRYIGHQLTEDKKKAIEDLIQREIKNNFRMLSLRKLEVLESDVTSHGFKLNMALDYNLKMRDDYRDYESGGEVIEISIDIQ